MVRSEKRKVRSGVQPSLPILSKMLDGVPYSRFRNIGKNRQATAARITPHQNNTPPIAPPI